MNGSGTSFPSLAKQAFLQIGVVIKPHGVRGEITVDFESDFPEWLCERACFYVAQGAEFQPWRVERARLHKGRLVLKVDAVSSRDQAEDVRGQALFLPEDEFREVAGDPDYFLNTDLIGMDVVNGASGTCLGTVGDVLDMPSGNMLEVVGIRSQSLLIPFDRAFIQSVDEEKKVIVVVLPPGYLDCF